MTLTLFKKFKFFSICKLNGSKNGMKFKDSKNGGRLSFLIIKKILNLTFKNILMILIENKELNGKSKIL
jgi:hypothetical protein